MQKDLFLCVPQSSWGMGRRVLPSFPLRIQVEYLQVTLPCQGQKTGRALRTVRGNRCAAGGVLGLRNKLLSPGAASLLGHPVFTSWHCSPGPTGWTSVGTWIQLLQSGFLLLLGTGHWDWQLASPPGLLSSTEDTSLESYRWPPTTCHVREDKEDTQKEAEKCCLHPWQPSGSESWWLPATCPALGSWESLSCASDRSPPISISSLS